MLYAPDNASESDAGVISFLSPVIGSSSGRDKIAPRAKKIADAVGHGGKCATSSGAKPLFSLSLFLMATDRTFFLTFFSIGIKMIGLAPRRAFCIRASGGSWIKHSCIKARTTLVLGSHCGNHPALILFLHHDSERAITMKKGLGRAMDGRASFFGFRLRRSLICSVLLGYVAGNTRDRLGANHRSALHLQSVNLYFPAAVVRRPPKQRKKDGIHVSTILCWWPPLQKKIDRTE